MKAFATNVRPAKMQAAFPRGIALLQDIFAAAREINPAISGLTGVTPTHAVLQEIGNTTYYLVEVNAAQRLDLGYVA